MDINKTFGRRSLVKASFLGFVGGLIPQPNFADSQLKMFGDISGQPLPHDLYPAIKLSVASEIVSVAHFDLKRLKELVDPRPELAKAKWDWGFGDWESALDAASHVGRKDIIEYLVAKGAMPTIFTFAILGQNQIVESMIASYPGIQRNLGPHGISLLQHAKTSLQVDGVNKANSDKLVKFLESLGDADGKQYLPVNDSDKEKYLGDYRYGNGKDEGFSIKLNMRNMLSLGKLGKSGGALHRIDENEFTYQGAPSVTVKFYFKNERAVSLTLTEPGLKLDAARI
jgi:hypothetical protein